ncbi:MAG: penicillin-binding protein, partial [Paenibacillus sp.]|nr:penicillin-binding protein [Paenibacillus sp.]
MSPTQNSKTKGTKQQQPKRKPKRKFRKRKLFIWLLIAVALGLFCAMGGYIFVLLNGEKLYQVNLDKLDMAEAAVVYDVNGKEVTTLARENRELVTINEIPERLRQSFIATEDKRFNEHGGIDFWSIGRALVKDIVNRSAVEGGSTITQQLAKNMFLNADKTLFRKGTEASIALALENNLSKDKILELYLNRIYFGNRAYGVKAAAKKYFGKSDLNSLELWEMATLAAIPKAPAYYNPIDHPDRSKERRGVVLLLLRDQGYITEAERAQAAAVDYAYKPPATNNDYATFIDFMLKEAVEKSGKTEDELLRGGYSIYTTMDPVAQKAIEAAYAKDSLFQKDGPKQKMQSSMVIVNHKTGGIVGMIG